MGVRTYLYTYFARMRKKNSCSELNNRLRIPIQVVIIGKLASMLVLGHFPWPSGRSAPDL